MEIMGGDDLTNSNNTYWSWHIGSNTSNEIITQDKNYKFIPSSNTTVYVNDQRTGKPVLAGGFTSFQKTMRNATEPYMPFGRKTPRLLDGEFQYGWVLERGMLDIRVMEEVFGFDNIFFGVIYSYCYSPTSILDKFIVYI